MSQSDLSHHRSRGAVNPRWQCLQHISQPAACERLSLHLPTPQTSQALPGSNHGGSPEEHVTLWHLLRAPETTKVSRTLRRPCGRPCGKRCWCSRPCTLMRHKSFDSQSWSTEASPSRCCSWSLPTEVRSCMLLPTGAAVALAAVAVQESAMVVVRSTVVVTATGVATYQGRHTWGLRRTTGALGAHAIVALETSSGRARAVALACLHHRNHLPPRR